MAQLSALMHHTATTMAAQIEEGDFDALTPFEREGLRSLALTIEGWADRAETMEGELLLAQPCAERAADGLPSRWWAFTSAGYGAALGLFFVLTFVGR